MTPVTLVISDTDVARSNVADGLRAYGWRVFIATTARWGDIVATGPPSLVVVRDVIAGQRTTPAMLRASAVGEAPLIAWGPAQVPPGYDGRVPEHCPDEEIGVIAARWWPETASAMLERLERSMGVAEVDPLLIRLRGQLSVAAMALDAGDVPVEAHRIAGIAGMLGFGELGAAWLAVSHREPGGIPAARIATRRALLALSRR